MLTNDIKVLMCNAGQAFNNNKLRTLQHYDYRTQQNYPYVNLQFYYHHLFALHFSHFLAMDILAQELNQ